MKRLSFAVRPCLAASLLVAVLWTNSTLAADFALGPEAVTKATEIRSVIEAHTGLSLGPPRIVERRVIIPLAPGPGVFQILAPGQKGAATSHGALVLPDGFPPEQVPSLVTRLSQLTPPLRWTKVDSKAEPSRYIVAEDEARALREARIRTVKARAGETVKPLALESGELKRFRFIRWLANRGEEPDDEGELDRWKRIRQAFRDFPKNEPGVFGEREKIRGAPKLWVYAALAAEAQGDKARALAYADVATRFALSDADALHVWKRLTKD